MTPTGGLEAVWTGPCGWPGYADGATLRPTPRGSGLYLMTFEYGNGYLVYAAGITRRPVASRLREHTRKYLNGEYTVLDVASLRQGVRKEIWHGWGYARAHREEFEARKTEIVEAARAQLSSCRIFVADPGSGSRVLERFEAARPPCRTNSFDSVGFLRYTV